MGHDADCPHVENQSRPFTTTDYQAVFWAWDLSKRSQEDGYARIAGSMMGAQVDLNPHQIDAALFALKSPLSKGGVLADEVGLGKTIEAGIIIAQRWAEPMELFGLLSFIDPHSFGSEESFRAQYVSLADEGRFLDLRKRIEPFFYRTLRRQVLEYIKYTETYTPDDEEPSFYDDFTAWLARDDLFSIPAAQRPLLTLVLHKLLASSTFAVQNALARMERRLQDLSAEWEISEVLDDLDGVDAEAEEWEEAEDQVDAAVDRGALEEELSEIREFLRRVRAIGKNAKGDKLLTALELGFRKMRNLGAADKAIIFTESKRTQRYLQQILADSAYAGAVVLFNGDNKDPESKAIYTSWLAQNQGSDRISGSPTADIRAALVDYFKHSAKIMIATEAAAEGVNLQFCSLVINYDLPWNPQRIEQRIGRCHRYGQKFDVVVINFLNTKNRADERVYELLQQKLKLFDGVFGASDEVLGALGSGVDFERRILGIYQTCRTRSEIDEAFGQLQLELDETIAQTMAKAQRTVLENLDEEVRQRLKMRESEAIAIRSSQERALYFLTKHLLDNQATWNDKSGAFTYQGDIYRLLVEEGTGAHAYRIQHPLAQRLIEQAKSLRLEPAEVQFWYTGTPVIGALKDLIGSSGWMQVEVLTRRSTHETEEIIVVGALTDDGSVVLPDVAQKLFQLPAKARPLAISIPDQLQAITDFQRGIVQDEAQQRQQSYFSTEIDKLDLWAEDLKNGLELRIKELEVLIKETKKASMLAITLEDKLMFQK